MIDFLHKWLGIPADEQPPNHYRLLGLRVFEDDPEVIDAAADKHLAFLHNLANGAHGEAAEDLSNQISATRVLLLNKTRKSKYDAELRVKIVRDQGKAVGEGLDRITTKSPAPARTPPQLPRASIPAKVTEPSLPAKQSYLVENAPRSVNSAVTAASGAGTAYGIRKPISTRSRAGVKRRGRRVSWFNRSIRFSTVIACLGIVYVAYGLLTGTLVLDWDPLLQLLPEASTRQSLADPNQEAITEMRSGSGRLGEAELKRTQPSTIDAVRGARKSSSEDMPEELTPNEGSDDSSHESVILSDELIEKEVSEILRIHRATELFDQLDNDHKEEVACYFYNQAVKKTNEGDENKGLAYFTIAYRRMLELKRYQACLSVLDSISKYYPAYPIRERKLGLMEKQLKISLEPDRSLFLACCELIEECVRNGAFIDANRLWDSLSVSSCLEDTQSEELVALRRSITEFQEAFESKEAGENRPSSSESSESIGVFYCFYADDWEKGLEHLSESGGEYSEPADLERKSVSPLKIAEAWEKVWKEEELPIRKQAIGRRMLTNYNKHRLQDPGSVQTTLGKKLDRFVKQVFPRTANEFVWGRNAFPRVMDTTAKAVDGNKPDVSKGNQFERSRRLTFMVAAGDTGEQFAAIELDNVSQIKVDVKQTVQLQTREMTRGLIVDYHTPGGYFSRVFMRFDQNQRSFENVVSSMPWSEVPVGAARANRIPAKSCGARPVDVSIRLDERDLRIDLENWAPPNWDGRVWFMVYLEDARPGYVLSCTAKW
jgi:hypothetical protein